ncbi:MAG TPA: DUF4142 domain-containing protein [Caulobacteraceae bacterium]|jgi:putative membrane protein|nr:DUF4142 domain-containing protein [Caulobacteraceae bacterium]
MRRQPRLAGLAVAGALLSAPAWAQAPPPPSAPAQPAAASASDASFIQAAVQADTDEIQMGQLLADRGSARQVRAFGQMLVQDHTQSRQGALAAAHAMGVVAAETMDADGVAADRDLHGRTGADFDREAKKLAIAAHQKAIASFDHQVATGHGPAADYARQTVPVLRRHLAAAQKLPG